MKLQANAEHQENDTDLGKLFSEEPQRDLRFFGDFILEGDAQLGAVAALYGLKLDAQDAELQLAQLMAREIGGEPVVGDQIECYETETVAAA